VVLDSACRAVDVATDGLEARCGPATGLPSARCERREPVRGSVFRAAQQARTGHATSHRTAEPAPCVAAVGREARCRSATGLPSARCVRREPVRGSAFRAALQARTMRATSHRTADPAPCAAAAGREARCWSATGLPSARCERREPVRGSVFRAELQARTMRATSHRTADPAPCVAAAGEARCRSAMGLPSAPCVRREPVRGSVFRAAQQARTKRTTAHRTADPAPCAAAVPRQPAGVADADADADGCSAVRTASTTGCAPPGSVNSVDCAVIQYGSAKASARPTSPLRAKYPSTR
jgi:hypothetical protein